MDFVRASEADLPSVRALLAAAQLPADATTRGAGEAIALPPGVRHAVRAGPRGATAVDAWSPPTVPYSAETP